MNEALTARSALSSALGAAVLAALLSAAPAEAQQQPIFGCHSSPSCNPGPLRVSGVNDPAAQSLLFGAGVAWGPGFRAGLVMPSGSSAPAETTPATDVRKFHLWGARLLPPKATPTPAPASKDRSAAAPR